MGGPWAIELLGWLRVERDGSAVTRFRTHKTGALLAYLAYFRERSHPRETLIEMFWPDGEPAASRNSLSQALTSLRRQLEPPGTAEAGVIIASRASIQLNPAACTVDVKRFERAIEAAGEAAPGNDRVRRLIEAVDLYRGELLPGFYQEWIAPERERLRRRHAGALRDLVAGFAAAGDLDRALDYARRRVAADPLVEEGTSDLMRLEAAAGQPQTALRRYRDLERALEREMGVRPSPPVRALARKIERSLSRPSPPDEPPRAAAAPGAHRVGPAEAPVRPEPLEEPLERAGPPEGTVTFLVADLAGEGGDGLHALALRHRGHVARQAAGCLALAFARPSDALSCALALRHALGERGRIALDTGEVAPGGAGYRGAALDRTLGALLAAHPGQTLCSEETAVLLRRGLEPEVALADLGIFRLPEVATPARLFEVNRRGDPRRDFPPPLAEPLRRGGLPLQFSPFYGRDEEIGRLTAALGTETTRLVTITGPGGIGKTRLALEAASRLLETFRGSIFFVRLADLADPRLVAGAVLDVMRLPHSPAADPLRQIAEALAGRRALLLLDEFEHLAAGGADVVRRLLELAPELQCLLTSRRLLRLAGERAIELGPLPMPPRLETPERLGNFASVRLFVGAAQVAKPDFQITPSNAAAIAAICERLEGIPLALELAAARSQVLAPSQILARLERRFDLLVGRRRDAPPRHRSLRAAIDGSYDLLSPEIGRFFSRLSVFRGGFTLEAAAAVCEEPRALDALAELRECSLVLSEEGARGMRFRLLETLREYARERLAREDLAPLGRRHAEHYLALAEAAVRAPGGPDQGAWLDRLAAEHENFRAALDWCEAGPAGRKAGLALSGALWRFWSVRGHVSEGRERLARALARRGGPAAVRARALLGAGTLAMAQGDYAAAERLIRHGLAIRRRLGDRAGTAEALNALGTTAWFRGRARAARAFFEESLAIRREVGDRRGVALALNNLGLAIRLGGDHAVARAHFEESLAISRALGERSAAAHTLNNLALMARVAGDHARARALCEESLALYRDLGDRRGIAHSMNELAVVVSHLGDDASARSWYEASLAIFREIGSLRETAYTLADLGALENARGDHGSARRLLEESLTLFERTGEKRGLAVARKGLADAARGSGDHAAARALYAESLITARDLGHKQHALACVEGIAALALSDGDSERAARLLGAAAAAREALASPLPPSQRERQADRVGAIRKALGAARFEAAWRAGRSWSLERAVAFALGKGERARKRPS